MFLRCFVFLLSSIGYVLLASIPIDITPESPIFLQHSEDDINPFGVETEYSTMYLTSCSVCKVTLVVGFHVSEWEKSVFPFKFMLTDADPEIINGTFTQKSDKGTTYQYGYYKTTIPNDTFMLKTIVLTERVLAFAVYFDDDPSVPMYLPFPLSSTIPIDKTAATLFDLKDLDGPYQIIYMTASKTVISTDLIEFAPTKAATCNAKIISGFQDDDPTLLEMNSKSGAFKTVLHRDFDRISLLVSAGGCSIWSMAHLYTAQDQIYDFSPFTFVETSFGYPETSEKQISFTRQFEGDPILASVHVDQISGGTLRINLKLADRFDTIYNSASFQYDAHLEKQNSEDCFIRANYLTLEWIPNPDAEISAFKATFRTTNDPKVHECGDETEQEVITEYELTAKNYFLFSLLILFFIPIILRWFLRRKLEKAMRKIEDEIEFERNFRLQKVFAQVKQKEVHAENVWEIEESLLHVKETISSGKNLLIRQGTYNGALPCILIDKTLLQKFPISSSGFEVAIKTPISTEKNDHLLNEINLMKTIGYHPFITILFGTSTSPGKPLLLTEFCAMGDLLSNLKRPKDNDYRTHVQALNPINREDLQMIAYRIADAMDHLSNMGKVTGDRTMFTKSVREERVSVVHRALMAKNILLTIDKVPKLSGFSYAVSGETTDVEFLDENYEELAYWTAPEAIERGLYSEKSDLWSFGVFLWELFSSGETPYDSMDKAKMLKHLNSGHRLEVPIKMPAQIGAIMKKCFEKSRKNRPTFKSVFSELHVMLHAKEEKITPLNV